MPTKAHDQSFSRPLRCKGVGRSRSRSSQGTLGVDVERLYAKYLTIKGKSDVIKELKSAVKGASEVYLATDLIVKAKRLRHLAGWKLPIPSGSAHEITKEAVLAALKSTQDRCR